MRDSRRLPHLPDEDLSYVITCSKKESRKLKKRSILVHIGVAGTALSTYLGSRMFEYNPAHIAEVLFGGLILELFNVKSGSKFLYYDFLHDFAQNEYRSRMERELIREESRLLE